MKKDGFVMILVVGLVAVIGAFTSFAFYQSHQGKTATTKPTPEALTTNPPLATMVSSPTTPSKTNSPTTKPTVKPATPKPTTKPLVTTTPNVTQAPQTSCNYDTNGASGAIQFTLIPSNGSSLYWSRVAEIKALNGCKVLDGKSTDTIQRSISGTSISIPTIYAGTYQVRVSYNNSWTSSQTINVSAGQQTNVSFSINNSSDPTPTPAPTPLKPTCTTPIAVPSGLSVSVYIGVSGWPESTSSITTIDWDFDGNGSWDQQTNYGFQGTHTYTSAGTYTIKARLNTTYGTSSDPCQTSVTVN